MAHFRNKRPRVGRAGCGFCKPHKKVKRTMKFSERRRARGKR